MYPWIEMDKYPYSAAKLFLKSLTIPELSFPCNGFYIGDHLFDECEKGDIEEAKPGEIKTVNPSALAAAFEKWAKCFRIGYEDGSVVFDFDNGEGTQRACLKISMDWGKWAAVYFGDYMEFGDELLFTLYLEDNSHSKIDEIPSAVAFENGEMIFKDWDGKEVFRKTPQEFIEDIAEATRHKWAIAFENWIFIYDYNGLMKKIEAFDKLEKLLAKKKSIEAQYRLIRKGYAESDSVQLEVKAELKEGDTVYGVAFDIPENADFVKNCLGFKGEINDCRHCTFDLPLRILNCRMY
jgi:hypothetical protein